MMISSEASSYLSQLDIIRKVRDKVSSEDELELPQICVVGDQSSGKSTFLSRLTGVTFPTDSKMCTKAAVVVTCTRDKSLAHRRYEIADIDSGEYKVVQSTAESIKEAEARLLGNVDSGNHIVVENEIKLRVAGPDVIDIIIIDLPGIQHAGPAKSDIITLIERYICRPVTLICLVSEAKQDAELTKAIELAKKYDPKNERTLRILSKFDNFDSNDTKKRATTMVEDGLIEVLGPHAIVSIGEEEKVRLDKTGEEDELKQLCDEYEISNTRAGIASLKTRLQPLFADLMSKNLPCLKEDVVDKLQKARLEIDMIGHEPMPPMTILFKCNECLRSNLKNLEKRITSETYLLFKEGIYDVERDITFDFVTEDMKLNALQCVLFQGGEEFNHTIQRIRDKWEPMLLQYVETTCNLVAESMSLLKNHKETAHFSSLVTCIEDEYQEYFHKCISSTFLYACKKCLEKEIFYGTSDSHFDSKYSANEIMPQKLEQTILENMFNHFNNLKASDTRGTETEMKNSLHKVLKDTKDDFVKDMRSQDLLEIQKRRLHYAVLANFDIEKKTFTDNILKETISILIKGRCDWINYKMLQSQKIVSAAKEDDSIPIKRQRLKQCIRRLEECLTLLHGVPLPTKFYKKENQGDTKIPFNFGSNIKIDPNVKPIFDFDFGQKSSSKKRNARVGKNDTTTKNMFDSNNNGKPLKGGEYAFMFPGRRNFESK